MASTSADTALLETIRDLAMLRDVLSNPPPASTAHPAGSLSKSASGVGHPGGTTVATPAQAAVNVLLNQVMADFRNIERSARTLTGVTVDREVLSHISGATMKTNPDILLQNTLQELMEAKASADTTKKALLTIAAALGDEDEDKA